MGNELQKTNGNVLPVEVKNVNLTTADVRKFIAPTATDKELWLFMGMAKALGLNPLKREIYFVKYGNGAAQVVVGYQVYLNRAEASGRLAGWDVRTEKTTDDEKAIVTIHRKDWDQPFVWEVYRSEVDKQQSTWKAMPQFMLKKVAIAQAFRMCFPEEVGSLPYLEEEARVIAANQFRQEVTEPKEIALDSAVNANIEEMKAAYLARIEDKFDSIEDAEQWQKTVMGDKPLEEWTMAEYNAAFDAMDGETFDEEATDAEVEEVEAEVIEKEKSGDLFGHNGNGNHNAPE